MLQRIVVTGVLAVVAVTIAACSLFQGSPKPPPEPVTVSADQSGPSVALASGQDLVVRLPSNPTTGYRWIYVEPKDAVLESRPARRAMRAQSAGGAAGARGTEIWKLAPFKPGQQLLRFEYRRPWEQDVAPSRVATHTVTVK